MCVYGRRGEMTYDGPPVDQRLVPVGQRAAGTIAFLPKLPGLCLQLI